MDKYTQKLRLLTNHLLLTQVHIVTVVSSIIIVNNVKTRLVYVHSKYKTKVLCHYLGKSTTEKNDYSICKLLSVVCYPGSV